MGSVTDTKGRQLNVPKPTPAPPAASPRPAPVYSKLLACPTCAGPVSRQADACPKCGHKFRQAGGVNMRDPVHFVGVLIVVFIVLSVAAVIWANL